MEKKNISAIILHDGESRVFLQQRAKNKKFMPGTWSYFGGEVLKGETLVTAVKREAKRELNFISRRPKFVISSRFQHDNLLVKLNLFTEECRDVSQIHLRPGYFGAWVSKEELSSLPVLDHDRHLISYLESWLKAEKQRNVSIILLYDDDLNFLLQKRAVDSKFLPGYWAMFGGGIEADESAMQAVIRESKEELDIDLVDPHPVIESTYHHDALRVYMHVFVQKCTNKHQLKLQEGEDWGWFSTDEIKYLRMLDHDRDIIRYVDRWVQSFKSK